MVAQALAMTVMIMTGRATEEGVARHLGRRRSGRVVAMVMRPAIPRIRGTEAGSGLGPDILGCRALDFVGTVACPGQRAGPAWFVGRRAGSGLAMQDGQGGVRRWLATIAASTPAKDNAKPMETDGGRKRAAGF